MELFSDRLTIREHGQHAKCSTCVRHKLILAKLGQDRAAYSQQMSFYSRHLFRQYKDRTVYWRMRAASRLHQLPSGEQTVTCICDGMDHSKYRWPRHVAMVAKDFGSFIRPTLDATGVLCHGHFAFIALSESWVAKDSSWTVEMIAHTLHVLSGRTDLRTVSFCLQADNCTREVKNNSMARYLSTLVCTKRLKNASMTFLQSGHSHEDIDAMYGHLAGHLERCQDLPDPLAFRDAVADFLQKPGCRPHEPVKEVTKVDAVRDWSHGSTFLRLLRGRGDLIPSRCRFSCFSGAEEVVSSMCDSEVPFEGHWGAWSPARFPLRPS